MKILVADDDRLDRKLLSACLEKAGYVVQLAEDGLAALRALVQPDAPQIALLDWSMPGLTGIDVCSKLRSVKLPVRPYVIMITAKTDKPDIANALDAGADDFVTKPFNSGELLARIRVARRTIQYQSDLRQQLRAFETLATRYNLLGEIAALQESGADSGASVPVVATAAGSSAATVSAAAGADSDQQGIAAAIAAGVMTEAPPVETVVAAPLGVLGEERNSDLMQRFLQQRGVGPVSRHTPPAPPPPAARITAWAGLILVREKVWIDLLLDAELASATCVFARFLHQRPGGAGDLPSFLAEAQTIFSAMYKTALQEDGCEVLSPYLSHARAMKGPLAAAPGVQAEQTLHFDVGGAYLGLTIRQHRCAPRLKSAGQVRCGDVMADAFPQGIAETPPFLARGVVLTERFIGKLADYDETTMQANTVPVFEPTLLALQFCDGAA